MDEYFCNIPRIGLNIYKFDFLINDEKTLLTVTKNNKEIHCIVIKYINMISIDDDFIISIYIDNKGINIGSSSDEPGKNDKVEKLYRSIKEAINYQLNRHKNT